MEIYVSSKRWINPDQDEFRWVYPWRHPWLRNDVFGSDPTRRPHNSPSICIWVPLSLRLFLWADLCCVELSPWDMCIDQFNTRQPTWETSLWSGISSLAQREQRTCLSYLHSLQWMQLQSLQIVFFVVIRALGCWGGFCADWYDYGYW